ncbi:MAG: hypothetical protein Q8Q08_05595 [Candidatus Omnitrophota bacterium]|nr:hypothetical protein [Candidatus Omnitrophota bacterium]
MRRKTGSQREDIVKRIGKLVKDTRRLARTAERQYSLEVEAILRTRSRDPARIEKCLDGMLDFCFHDGVLVLYKKLCRYYFDIDPEAVVSYVHAYRDIWDEPSVNKGFLKEKEGKK